MGLLLVSIEGNADFRVCASPAACAETMMLPVPEQKLLPCLPCEDPKPRTSM